MSNLSSMPDPGAIVVYKLRPEDLPVNPEREWKGKVLETYPQAASMLVESLEAGYEGLTEIVTLCQVKG